MTKDAFLFLGDCLDILKDLPANSIDSIVTDPPYGLSFMGKRWDYDVPSVAIWAECLRVLKPGGHLLAFAGTRTQHRMAVRIEDAGFEIRDMIAWVYGSGFPKSMDVAKAIDASDAAEARRARQLRFTEWMRSTGLTGADIDRITGTNMGGHYTTAASQPAVATREHLEALRPHFEDPVPAWVEEMVDERTVESENTKRREVVGQHEKNSPGNSMRMGMLGVPEETAKPITAAFTPQAQQWEGWGTALKPALEPITVARKPLVGTVAANVLEHGTGAINVDGCRITDGEGNADADANANGGRWPANLIHDGSDEVLAAFPNAPGQQGKAAELGEQRQGQNTYGAMARGSNGAAPRSDSSTSAARFFYCPKASKADKGADNAHPTVKPTDLMRYLCRMVTQPGGVVLDPFMGSGSTGKAAGLEGFGFIGVERERPSFKTASGRIAASGLSVTECD